MDDLGYDYMAFTDFHFKDDLQYEDAVPMLKRLMDVAAQEGLSFGVKLTNTFPVDIKRQELPGEEMYMSGKALFPLSISVAARLAESFDGKLPMSFSGGADQKNIDQIVDCGIWPVTVATVLLKPGGYKWMTRIAEKTAACQIGKSGEVHVERVTKLAADALENANYQKNSKKAGKRKEEKSPLLDCLRKEDVSARKEFTVHKRVCGNCADVCPNRANVLIEVPEMELLQIIHVDYMCNECGNCRSFCQYAGAPYKDKFTLFANEEDMKDSINNGFTVLDAKNKEIKIRIGEKEEVVRADQKLAQRVRNIRKRRSISQEKLSSMSGVSYGSIKRFETTGQISLISLTKIAMALDIADELRNIFTHVPYKDIQEVINEGR